MYYFCLRARNLGIKRADSLIILKSLYKTFYVVALFTITETILQSVKTTFDVFLHSFYTGLTHFWLSWIDILSYRYCLRQTCTIKYHETSSPYKSSIVSWIRFIPFPSFAKNFITLLSSMFTSLIFWYSNFCKNCKSSLI